MNEILIILRSIIQDLDGSIYSDESLTRLIVTSALLVKNEVYYEDIYTVDITNSTITPDPTNNDYIILVAFKASILLIQTEVRKQSQNSFKITDGPSSIDMTGSAKDFKSLLDSLMIQYEKIKRDYTLTQNSGYPFGYVVTTPTTVSYISPEEFD